MMSGWIKLHRRILDHWLYEEEREFSKFEAFIDLLLRANYEERKFLLSNELISVKRGQHITSVRKLANRWRWSTTKVNSFISMLEKEKMLEKESDTQKTRITLLNYEVYQGGIDVEAKKEETKNNAKETRKNTNKKVKEELKSKEDKENKENKEAMQLTNFLIMQLEKHGGVAKEPDVSVWAGQMKPLLKDYSFEELKRIIYWSQNNEFWKKVIRSPKQLIRNFTKLYEQFKAENIQSVRLERPKHWIKKQTNSDIERSKIKDYEKELPF